ncbi:MAG: hypothetical protein CMJ75_22830 [Planctomycetaceae bacterium]|nr:hypothetical protein [Planctomycetaceae bacterium]
MSKRTVNLRAHTTSIKGADFLKIHGLLALAYEVGLESIETRIHTLDLDRGLAVVEARVAGARGTYSGHGLAHPESLSRGLQSSFVQVAESRAIARALRHFCAIGAHPGDHLPERQE